MDKSNKFLALKLSLLAALFLMTPLAPTSFRPTFLYFVFNLLIIALGAEAGLLSFISKSASDEKKKLPANAALKPLVASESSPKKFDPSALSDGTFKGNERSSEKPKVVQKSLSEKASNSGVKLHNKVKKCPSTPSIFFIGGGENEAEELVHYGGGGGEEGEKGEEAGELTGQELFTQAETFIGNFYKQLKMQREESWKRIHGLYHKAF